MESNSVSAADYPELFGAVQSGNLPALIAQVQNPGHPGVNTCDENGSSLLLWASFRGHCHVMTWLLDNGADIEARNTAGITPLIGAAMWRHAPAVTLLLERGADITAQDRNGLTALRCAEKEGGAEAAAALRQWPERQRLRQEMQAERHVAARLESLKTKAPLKFVLKRKM